MSTATEPTEEEVALRAEHDRLSASLAARRSIDFIRRGAYASFSLAISCGLSVKLAYDRWGPHPPKVFKGPPLFFFLAVAAASICLLVTAASFIQARRLMKKEDADFARFHALRQRLGLDP